MVLKLVMVYGVSHICQFFSVCFLLALYRTVCVDLVTF